MPALSLNRRSLAPIHCASTDKSREHLTTLHFEPDGTTVATNGHVMAVVTPGEPLHESQHLNPFELNVGDLAPILKEQRKKNATPADVNRLKTNTHEHCRIDTGMGSAVEIPKVQCTYPDWKQVLPTDPTYYSVRISLHVLESMIASARQFTGTRKGEGGMFGVEGRKSIVQFDFHEDTECKPFTVTAKDKDSGDTLKVVMMPCKS